MSFAKNVEAILSKKTEISESTKSLYKLNVVNMYKRLNLSGSSTMFLGDIKLVDDYVNTYYSNNETKKAYFLGI